MLEVLLYCEALFYSLCLTAPAQAFVFGFLKTLFIPLNAVDIAALVFVLLSVPRCGCPCSSIEAVNQQSALDELTLGTKL